MGTAKARRRTIEIDIKGEPYTLTEFSARDLASFEEHILSKRVRQFRQSSEGMDEIERLNTMSTMVKTGMPVTEIFDEMNTMSGALFLLHASLAHTHPDMTIDDVGDLLDMTNLTEISVLLQSLGADVEPADTDPQTPPAAEAIAGNGANS